MLSKTGNKTFELTLFIAIMLILPVWISADYALDFLSEFHCQSPILILACGYHRPERTAILASLSIFHFAVVIGNISVAWLLYHRRLLVALFVSMAVCGFFVAFLLEYASFAGEAVCAQFEDQSANCGRSLAFITLFLEHYDKCFLVFFPLQFLWLLTLVAQQKWRTSPTLK